MGKHTPGPWQRDGRTVYSLNDEGVNRFCAHVQDAHAPAYELDANARLIAAAPDLLEALEDIFQDVEYATDDIDGSYFLSEGQRLKVRAAIAKAKGEQ